MKILNFQKIAFVVLMMFFIPIYLYSNNGVNKNSSLNLQNVDSLAQMKNSKIENALGEKFYLKWRKSKVQSNLDSAQAHFFKACNYLPEHQKHDYSLEKARLFHQNKEECFLVKDWYLKSIESIIVRSPQNVEELLKKYTVMEEFVKLYARTYGKCDDALEILQDYKSDLYFYYIEKNTKEKKYTELMERLKIEERFLVFDCNIK
ncbi:MAG: hypothetical protein HYU68_04120 [Bacteroidetes bacterium]|nr:hypothetical protein [Bacteroidota bacterium]